MNLYAEYLVSRRKTLFDFIVIILMVLAAVFATVALMSFLVLQIYGMFAALAIAGVWYVAYLIIGSRNIEYEYCVTENIFDIDIITAKRNRKKLVSFDLKNAEIIAPATTDYINEFENKNVTSKIDASAGDSKVLDFFAIYKTDGGNLVRVVFTPDMRVLEMIKKANPRNTFFE